MIRVARSLSAEAIAALNRRGANGLTEREHALWFYGDIAPDLDPLPPKPTKPPKFSCYRALPVKAALSDLFGNRCAYCESVYAVTGPMDVEHYRPKQGYLDDDGVIRKPGYYWLAADWENLLPSCGDCNRERGQLRSTRQDVLRASKSGKANKFPLATGTLRAATPSAVNAEVPLLLDPSAPAPAPEPGDHLRFFCQGFVEPAATPQEAAHPRGLTTIAVCGLDRHELVAARAERAVLLRGVMTHMLEIDADLRLAPGAQHLIDRRVRVGNELTRFRTGPYQALVGAMIATFDAVRVLARGYHAAKAAFDVDRSDQASADLLRQQMGLLRGLYASPQIDQALLVQLCALAQLPSPA